MSAFPRSARSVLVLALASVAALWSGPVWTQEPEFFEVPWADNQWTYGRQMDMSQFRYCVDPRDPEWEVAAAIADTIARGLLLEPVRYVVDTGITVTEDITRVYEIMLQHCDVHMGFKLIPEGYESWITLSRAYYQAQYAYIAIDPNLRSLGDLPRGQPIAATIGTLAHINLLGYMRTLPADQRWPIFPQGNNDLALQSLLNGTVRMALVWEPTLWGKQRTEPATYAAIHAVAPAPMQPTQLGVGALLLANQTFLRAAVDEAIAALTADGTIAEILAYYGFPGTPVP